MTAVSLMFVLVAAGQLAFIRVTILPTYSSLHSASTVSH